LSTRNTTAEIITIGDEILIGQIIDTNSAWIAQQLNLIGINVLQITSISDNKNHIINALNEASLRVNLILVTGGLGPTKDDITKQTIAEFFNAKLVRNQEVFEHISKLMGDRNISMNPLNVQQADVPDNCIVIPNNYGTAPAMWFEKTQIIYIFMPGVPFEMKGILSEQLLPKLKNQFENLAIYHKTLLLFGIAESELAIRISSWEDQLPAIIKLAYLPSYGLLRLRLSAKGDQQDILQQKVELEVEKIRPVIKSYLIGEKDEPLEVIIYNLCKNLNITISIAESCTGGKIANLLTSIPGSSVYFKGGVVAYANEIKEHVLKVDHSVLEQHGAVSYDVVKEMAQNIRTIFRTDYSLAVSGIAGPDGGTDEKPVGTTWIAAASANQIVVKKFSLGKHREQNIQRAAMVSLNELRKLILSENSNQ